MASTSEQLTPALSSTTLFEQLESYQWDSDEEFRSGLSAILGPNPSPEQTTELTLRARTFYYARKFGVHVDFDAYKAWKVKRAPQEAALANGQSTVAQRASNEPEPGPKLSYQEIVDMIQTGKPIPGIKDIPDTVLAGQGTTATKSVRRKPWEKDEPAAELVASVEAETEAA